MRTYQTIVYLLILNSAFTQNITHEWSFSTGSTDNDQNKGLVYSHDGMLLSIGTFLGSIDADPGTGVVTLNSAAYTDTYIRKVDLNGSLIWAKSFGGNQDDIAHNMTVDLNGNILICGNFYGTCDFDPGPAVYPVSAMGNADAFILKLDANGDFLWVATFGSSLIDRAYTVDTDASGNVYIGGYFQGNVDFDPGGGISLVPSSGGDEAFVVKLDAGGTLHWVKAFHGTSNEKVFAIHVDQNTDVIIGGGFEGVVDFDPGPGVQNLASNGIADAFVAKIDANGNYLWAIKEGGLAVDLVRHIRTDEMNKIYLSGYFSDIVDFNPSGSQEIHTAIHEDAFIQKLNEDGEFEWVQTFGGDSTDRVRTFDFDPFGNIFVIGEFMNVVDFDPGAGINLISSAGKEDLFISKFDVNGNYYWTETFGDADEQRYAWVLTGTNGELYTSGYFYGSVDFDPGIGIEQVSSLGLSDAFVVKHHYCIPTFSIIDEVACNSYVSPSGNHLWTSSGVYTDTLSSLNACGEDSILTINLTINTVNTDIDEIDEITFEAESIGGPYQWIDCETNSTIPGEVNQVFSASQNGSYAVIVYSGSCSDTSDCLSVSTVKLEEFSTVSAWISPNPFSNELTIHFPDLNEYVVHVSDLSGRSFGTFNNVKKDSLEIEINGAPGIYLIHLEGLGGATTFKASKQ